MNWISRKWPWQSTRPKTTIHEFNQQYTLHIPSGTHGDMGPKWVSSYMSDLFVNAQTIWQCHRLRYFAFHAFCYMMNLSKLALFHLLWLFSGSTPCYIRGCLARNANRQIPTQEWRCKYWKQFCRPLPTQWTCTRICDKHFSDDQFHVVNEIKVLKKNAVPTLHLPL